MATAADIKFALHIAYIDKNYVTEDKNQVTWLHFKFADRCETAKATGVLFSM